MSTDKKSSDRFLPAQIHHFARAVYLKLGVPNDDAKLLADTLTQADLWGHSSHGVMRTFWYAERLKTGTMKAASEIAKSVSIRSKSAWKFTSAEQVGSSNRPSNTLSAVVGDCAAADCPTLPRCA